MIWGGRREFCSCACFRPDHACAHACPRACSKGRLPKDGWVKGREGEKAEVGERGNEYERTTRGGGTVMSAGCPDRPGVARAAAARGQEQGGQAGVGHQAQARGTAADPAAQGGGVRQRAEEERWGGGGGGGSARGERQGRLPSALTSERQAAWDKRCRTSHPHRRENAPRAAGCTSPSSSGPSWACCSPPTPSPRPATPTPPRCPHLKHPVLIADTSRTLGPPRRPPAQQCSSLPGGQSPDRPTLFFLAGRPGAPFASFRDPCVATRFPCTGSGFYMAADLRGR